MASKKNQHYQIKLLEGVNHDLGMSPDGYDKNHEITPEHAQVITQWLEQLPEPGIQVDPIPTSTIPVEPSRPLAWYESIPLHLTLVSVVLLSTILVAILHWRGLKNRPGLLITSLNTLIVLGEFIYLGWILFSGAWETGPIIASRPLVWLLLQVVTLATLIFALVSVIKWLKLKSPTPRGLPLFLTLLNTISFTYLAWYWGLFTL